MWVPGGDVAAALEADRVNVNHNNQYAGRWPGVCTTYTSYVPLGDAPAAESGGPWRRVYARRNWTYGGPNAIPSCAQPPSYQGSDTAGVINGICGEGNNTGLLAGIDDACYCPSGWDWSDAHGRCVVIKNRWLFPPASSCQANPGRGNPIFPITGNKRQVVALGMRLGHETAELTYDSLPMLPYAPGSPLVNGKAAYMPAAATGLPAPWASSFHKGLTVAGHAIDAHRGGGKWVHFDRTGSMATAANGVSDRLVATASGWRYEDLHAGVIELYDGTGRIQSATDLQGRRLSYQYSDANTPVTQAPGPGLLIGLADQDGRSLAFDLDSSQRTTRVTSSDGTFVQLAYGPSGMLAQLTWQDGNSLRFLYERGDLGWPLTGWVDELGQRAASFGYGASGLSTSTARHGPDGLVGAHSVAYGAATPGWNVVEDFSSPPVLWRVHTFNGASSLALTTPTGSAQQMAAATLQGTGKLTAQSQAAGSGCSASNSSQAYDANGNIASIDDFNGTRTCFAYDPVRPLETVRVEGLAAGASCQSTAAGAVLPPGTRKLGTQWHPVWSLKTAVSEPGRITTYVYNGQPDPHAGGALASCAPADALLPDGRPIAVLCRQVEQATGDADGALGFAAPVQSHVAAREQRWTYNAQGQVLTHDGARTDVADITTHTYYGDTAFTGSGPSAMGHTRGDLMRTTNPAGHITQYTQYDKAGRLLQSVDPNGVTSSFTYDLRGRMTSHIVAGQATLYAWWPTGLIQRVTTPDGNWTFYEHDAAQRLWRVSDSLGNSVSYTLDAVGNRAAEAVMDPGGVLRRHVSRGIDALGRVELLTGRE